MPESGERRSQLTTDNKGSTATSKVAKNQDGKGVMIRKDVMKQQEAFKPKK